MTLKQELYNLCDAFVKQRLQTIQHTIFSNQKALQSETKSSAGDKHETGRAMLQLEMEKAGQQLQSIQFMKETLARINPTQTNNIVSLGSIVYTSQATYFLSISAGQLVVANKPYFAVSVSSPIGKLLLGKREKDTFVFNGKQLVIENLL
ncbi:MAG: 3-oxoacyl-ACP synthase [Flavobacteriaceae bacterium]|nr:3-oxoacyl-ACP synthase [Flavobacteriaceae bacterium]